jgi:hypothetical protein
MELSYNGLESFDFSLNEWGVSRSVFIPLVLPGSLDMVLNNVWMPRN